MQKLTQQKNEKHRGRTTSWQTLKMECISVKTSILMLAGFWKPLWIFWSMILVAAKWFKRFIRAYSKPIETCNMELYAKDFNEQVLQKAPTKIFNSVLNTVADLRVITHKSLIWIEVKSRCRSLITVWLNYKKAFDSVLHSWLIYALKFRNVLATIMNTISNLTECWYTILNQHGKNESLMPEVIKFLKGIFQGDGLSVLLFFLALSQLTIMLREQNGYFLVKCNPKCAYLQIKQGKVV